MKTNQTKPNSTLGAMRIKSALAFILAIGLSVAGFGQSFRNLDFEQATLIPVSGPYSGTVEIGPALPGWSVDTPAPFVTYNTMALDSANVAILDKGARQGTFTAFQGNFTILLQAGFITTVTPFVRAPVSIAQTGVIPTWAKTLLFDGTAGATNVVVSLGPFYRLASYADYNLYGVDVSRFAGQTVELRFTVYPFPPPWLPMAMVFLDDMQFSSTPLQSQFTYTINNGTIAITGFAGPAGALIIPSTINGLPVTSIGPWAFESCTSLTSLTIPVSVTNIGENAFLWCANLANVTIPNSVTTIGREAFQYCSSLTRVTIPDRVTRIERSTFAYCSSLANVTIPNSVTSIDIYAFRYCSSLTSLTIPDRVTTIGPSAFFLCTSLSAVYFMGNAPGDGAYVFTGDTNAIVYYLPGTTGWGPMFGGRPTVQGSLPGILTQPTSQTAEAGSTVGFKVSAAGYPPPLYRWWFKTNEVIDATTNADLVLTNIQTSHSGNYFVIVSNGFGSVTSAPAMLNVIAPVERRSVPGLSLMGQPGSILNLETADTLVPAPNWTVFDSVLMASASQWYFDLTTPLPLQRYFRAWQAGTQIAPALDAHLIPALTLTGAIGSTMRVDGINQFGPTDAWFPLATVTLTNTSQLYFDVSVIGQPPRLWRLVQVP